MTFDEWWKTDNTDGGSHDDVHIARAAWNAALEEAAVRFESGRTTLKGDAAALAAGTLRGYKAV